MTAPAIIEARRRAELALSGIDTLHLGPLDYNIRTTVDELLSAARLLEQHLKDQTRG